MALEERNINDFLANLLLSSKEALPGNSFTFEDFAKALKEDKIVLSRPNQYLSDEKQELPWMEEFKKALKAVIKIVANPRYHIYSFKEPTLTEKVTKIDSHDIIESSKNDAYWQCTDGFHFVPKMFSTTINETDICIYENRFVAYLVDTMLEFVNASIRDMRRKVRFASQNFAQNQVSYADADELLELANFKQFTYRKHTYSREMPLLTNRTAPFLNALKELYLIKKDLQRIQSTNFYRTLKRSRPLTAQQIHITNLLMGENNYRTCYNFYNRLLELRHKPVNNKVHQRNYYDFVVYTLLKTLSDLGFKFNKNRILFNNPHHVMMTNYVCEKEGIKARINVKENEIRVNFMVEYLNGKFHKVLNLHEKRQNNICFIMEPNLGISYTADEINDLFGGLVESKLRNNRYANAFVVTPHNEFNVSNAVVVSPFEENIDLSLKNAIQSSLIFTEGDSDIYRGICPICGAHVDGELEDGNCHCPECGSVWTSLISGDNHNYQHTIWFKSIKRSEQ